MSELKEHLFVPYSELTEGDELTDDFAIAKSYYRKDEADKVIAELEKKIEIYEDLGSCKKGCPALRHNQRRVERELYKIKLKDEAIAKLEAENAALKEEHRWRDVSQEKPEDGEIVWAYNKSLKQIAKVLHYGECRFVLASDHGCFFDGDLWMPMNTPKAPEDK